MATPHLERPATWCRVGLQIAPQLIFFILLLLLAMMHRQLVPPSVFGTDETYLNLVVARTLHQHKILGLNEVTPTPATADTLWQVLLSLGFDHLPRPDSIPLIVGAVVGLLTLIKTHSLGQHWNHSGGAVGGAILLAVASSLPMDVMRGQSITLSALVVTFLLVRYLEGGPREQWPLPLGTAWWAGLAALVHVELLVIWLVVALHAVITGPMRKGRGHGIVFPLLRMLSGIIIVGLVLSPALAWNMKVLSVPWPRMPDAQMALDAWGAAAPAEVGNATVALVGQVIGASYARAFSVPLLHGFLPLLFLALGLGYSMVDAVRDRQRLAGTVGLALLLVPLAYAAINPFVGWSAAPAVFCSLQPAWAVLIVRGATRAAKTICRLAHAMTRRDMPWLSPAWASSVVITIMVMIGVLRSLDAGRNEFASLPGVVSARARVAASLGDPAEGEKIASDQVGWLAYTRGSACMDLTGRVSPVLLAFRSDSSGWQGAEAANYLREQGVQRLVIWNDAYAYAEPTLSSSADSLRPRVSTLH